MFEACIEPSRLVATIRTVNIAAKGSFRHIPAMMHDPHAPLRDAVLDSVLNGPGKSDPALRRAAAAGSVDAVDLHGLVEKVHAHAYRVTDADVAEARAVRGDDQLFELIVSAALGASKRRLDAGLDALERA
jgi:hypothetical protein